MVCKAVTEIGKDVEKAVEMIEGLVEQMREMNGKMDNVIFSLSNHGEFEAGR